MLTGHCYNYEESMCCILESANQSCTIKRLSCFLSLSLQSSQLDADGKRSLTAELLLINPKYLLLENSLMPLWDACVSSNEDPQYLEKLLFIFSRVCETHAIQGVCVKIFGCRGRLSHPALCL